MDQSESVLMWSLARFGVSFRAVWIAKSSAVLFEWVTLLPIGALVFLGSFRPNHTPRPALALVSPLRLQEPSV